jgi:hypothetical protein
MKMSSNMLNKLSLNERLLGHNVYTHVGGFPSLLDGNLTLPW